MHQRRVRQPMRSFGGSNAAERPRRMLLRQRASVAPLVLPALFMLVLSPAFAHQLRQTETELELRPKLNTADMLITHRIHNDDAMLLLAQLGDARGKLDAAIKAQLLLYAERHFAVRVGDAILTAQPVGAQIDGDYLLIYQQVSDISVHAADMQITVRNTLMHDVQSGQSNLVHLIVDGTVQTRYFDGKQAEQRFALSGGQSSSPVQH